MESKKLQPGDKFLSIKITGHNPVAAFKNKEKKGNQPDYKGDGVAVWIMTKKDNDKQYKQEEI